MTQHHMTSFKTALTLTKIARCSNFETNARAPFDQILLCRFAILLVLPMSTPPSFSDATTRDDQLPPFQVAMICAFAVVIEKVQEILDVDAVTMLGMNKNDFIATQVTKKNGENPTTRSIEKTLAKCRGTAWYPGKKSGKLGGRPPTYWNFCSRLF